MSLLSKFCPYSNLKGFKVEHLQKWRIFCIHMRPYFYNWGWNFDTIYVTNKRKCRTWGVERILQRDDNIGHQSSSNRENEIRWMRYRTPMIQGWKYTSVRSCSQCSIIWTKHVFVFIRVQLFLKNPCSYSFIFGRTRMNTSVRSIRVRVRSSLISTRFGSR